LRASRGPISSSHPWTILLLLTLFMVINFWDRAAFGFASTAIMRDLRLSHAEFGLLAGAFFWLFSPSALLVGWLADRWSAKRIIGSMAVLWAIAQALTCVAGRVSHLFVSRLLLGLGEGPALPTAIHAAYFGFPRSSRPMVTAFLCSGAPLGIASGALLTTFLADAFGWRAAFLCLSLVSIGWSIVWFALQQTTSTNDVVHARGERRMKLPSGNSTTVGVIVAAFCVYWVLALAVNWFPAVLQVVNGLSPIREAAVLACAWALQIAVFPLAVTLSKSLEKRGCGGELVFAAPAACGVAVSGLALAFAGFGVATWAGVVLIALSLWSTAVTVTCLPPMIAEVTPVQERGAALGVFAAFSSTAGIFAPLAFGRIVDVAGGGAHGYRVALMISGALLLVAAPVALALMKPTRHAALDEPEDSVPEVAVFG
jgi:MFS transporter, ACS family, D-galactonate transporter